MYLSASWLNQTSLRLWRKNWLAVQVASDGRLHGDFLTIVRLGLKIPLGSPVLSLASEFVTVSSVTKIPPI